MRNFSLTLKSTVNKAVYILFFFYGIYFLAKYGLILNEQGLKYAFAAFWQRRESWIVISYCIALAYTAWIIINFFTLKPGTNRGNETLLKTASCIFIAAFMIRVVPSMFVFGPDSDMCVFQRVQHLTLDAHDWKSPVESMPYFYFQVYILHFAGWVSAKFHLAPYFIIKLPVITADSLIAAFIFIRTKDKAMGLMYMWNPVTILISSFHGMFDSETLLLILACIFIFEKKYSFFILGAMFGLAFQSKIWPLVLLPVFLMRMKSGDIARFLWPGQLYLSCFQCPIFPICIIIFTC